MEKETSNYRTLTPSELAAELEGTVQRVADLFEFPAPTVRLLLYSLSQSPLLPSFVGRMSVRHRVRERAWVSLPLSPAQLPSLLHFPTTPCFCSQSTFVMGLVASDSNCIFREL